MMENIADSNFIKSAFEDLNLSDIECDGDSEPEYLIPSEPWEDPYGTDNSWEYPQKEKPNEREKIRKLHPSYRMVTRSKADSSFHHTSLCNSILSGAESFVDALHLPAVSQKNRKNTSKMNEKIIDNTMKPVHVIHTPEFNFTKANNPSLTECLEELLSFALEENHERRSLIKGQKLFDGKTTNEIIQFWTKKCPKLKWLLDDFNHNIQSGIIEVKDIDKQQIVKSEEDLKELDTLLECKAFMRQFLGLLKTKEKYYTQMLNSSSGDDLCDQFKHVVPLIASFLNIPFRSNGNSKLKVNITAVQEKASGPCLIEHEVTVKSDFVLESLSNDGEVDFPVEVFLPKVNTKGVDVPFTNTTQTSPGKQNFKTEHLIHHIEILGEKIKRLRVSEVPVNLDDPLVSVGMFLTGGIVNFSKIQTTVRHMSSFMKPLLPYSVLYDFLMKNDEEAIITEMLNNVQENGLLVTKSQWHIDLSKGIQRNALLIFLVHYIWGYEYFVHYKIRL